ASGGSAGYDHKKMGITAKGAWESVKRHFRELGRDIQAEDFTVAGVGDMSGDVFGNGMLLSRHIRLVAAFNHMHIFVDPAPDPATSWAERRRLFDLPRSQWSDYDKALISPGGGVFERKAKSIALTPQVRDLLGVQGDRIEPNALVKAILRAPVDLLYLGGIGTYVKARAEGHADAGDRANDAVRIDGAELRARVVGEGANLGLTQRGRVELALAGGRINTDFIDNSAGVDCSDHEVNIKILLSALVRPAPGGAASAGSMSRAQRDALMAAMTDEVGELVLQDNYRQSLAITMMEIQAADSLEAHARFMRRLERSGRLDRAVEQLPDDEEIKARRAARKGLTRPELAVLLSYAKMDLYDSLLESDLPDDPLLVDDLVRYFPGPLRKEYRDAIRSHRLRREIIATTVTNSMVNRVGCAFVAEMEERSGQGAAAVARAYAVVRDVFGLRRLWAAVEELDGKVPAALQNAMLRETQRLIDRAVVWFLRNCPQPLNVSETQQAFAPGVGRLAARIAEMISSESRAVVGARAAGYTRQGAPMDLASRLAQLTQLSPAMEIVRIAQAGKRDVIEAGQAYFGLGERVGFDWLRKMALAMPRDTHWREMAAQAIVEDLVATQAELAQRLLQRGSGERAVEAWLAARGADAAHALALIDEMRRQESAMDFAMLAVANRTLRGLLAAA
ncbi:MAG: NAD-glutamate dehydrogenase, partial [Alphaproteobacteria bacterium]|nr:NAD-glutamate dehydrogenase [Alphaproteobacteria bacterium]